MRKALETQMNADVAQMNADKKSAKGFVTVLAASRTRLQVFICGPLRYICVHLRFQSLSLLS
jgi:hypothetical protein